MAQVAEHLVGRTAELDAFDRALTGLEQGGSAAIEVIGEPGIGKTRLLAELAARADAQGGLVLSGSASELERDLPFCVFVDALDEYIRGLESRRLEALEEDVRAELATVFPSLSAFAGDREVALPHERYRSHRAVRELLELLATTQPLVLLLDDLHWADPASVELLSALIRRPPAAPVLVALAVRPRQLPGPLSAALERAHRMDDIQRFELRPLTEPEAQELLGETVASSLVNALFEESGGNPFYLEQLARTPDRGPRAGGARSGAAVSLAGVEVPSMVAAALTEELALLSPSARRVLEGAAVAGDPFEPELAAAAAEVPESTAVEALDELLALDLVRATDVPRRFRFRHPIVRRAVYETTPAAWRLGAHERSAHALGLRGATAAALATHVERSARRGDPAAVGVLRKAGEQAALRAPESAARWFKVALEVLPATAPATDRIELLLPRAAALAAIGEYPESYAALLESLAIVPKHEAALRTKLTASCAGLEHLLGRHDHARTRLLDALDELPEGDSPESVSFMIELAVDRYYASCYDAMEDWARRALVAAKHLDDMPRAAAAAAVVALACAVECAKERADADCSEAAALVDGLSDDELAGRPDAISYLAYAELLLERFPQTGKHADRAIALARATGQGEQLPLLVSTRAIVWLLHGGLTEARAVLDDAVEAARLSNSARGMAWVRLNRSAIALAAGDLELALADAQESVDLTRGLDESFVKAWAGVNLAAALLESGEPERALHELVHLSGGEELSLIHGGWRVRALELLTRCRLSLGHTDDARQTAARAESWAVTVGLPFASAIAQRAAAAVELDAGKAEHAAELALLSARGADAAGAPIEAALSHMLAGRALGQADKPDQALAELQRAAGEFDRCGALRYRDAAERGLRALGHHVHRRSRSATPSATGVGSLTGRELEVARLVADGMTNPAIAAALFLSPKTVETHLRNIFRKLDVSSRVQVARAVERAEMERSGVLSTNC